MGGMTSEKLKLLRLNFLGFHHSGQVIIICHQPRFPWNFRGPISLTTTIWGPRSFEVPDHWLHWIRKNQPFRRGFSRDPISFVKGTVKGEKSPSYTLNIIPKPEFWAFWGDAPLLNHHVGCNLPMTSTQDPGAADCQELCAVVKCPCTRRWRPLVIHTCTGGEKEFQRKKWPSIQICKQNEHDFVFQFIAGGDDFFQKWSVVRFQKHLLNLPKFQPHSIWGAVKIYYNCLVCFWRVIVFWGGPYRFTGFCCFRHHPSRS